MSEGEEVASITIDEPKITSWNEMHWPVPKDRKRVFYVYGNKPYGTEEELRAVLAKEVGYKYQGLTARNYRRMVEKLVRKSRREVTIQSVMPKFRLWDKEGNTMEVHPESEPQET